MAGIIIACIIAGIFLIVLTMVMCSKSCVMIMCYRPCDHVIFCPNSLLLP